LHQSGIHISYLFEDVIQLPDNPVPAGGKHSTPPTDWLTHLKLQCTTLATRCHAPLW